MSLFILDQQPTHDAAFHGDWQIAHIQHASEVVNRWPWWQGPSGKVLTHPYVFHVQLYFLGLRGA